MTIKTHVLVDSASGISHDDFRLESSAAEAENWTVSARRLRGGRSEGVLLVNLNNGAFSIDILPTRGMGLWRGNYRGIPVGWSSPVKGPVHPSFVNATERSGLGWLTGFDELLCRCGLASNGAPGVDVVRDNTGAETETVLTLHGKIANLPAHFVEVSVEDGHEGRIALTGHVDETMLFGPCLRLKSTVETILGSNTIRITDIVENLSAQPAEFQLLYHTNIGRPFLEENSQLIAPIRSVSPRDGYRAETIEKFDRYAEPVTEFREEAFFFDLAGDDDGRTRVLLCNAKRDLGFSLAFSREQLPCFTLWKNTQAEADGYVTGLEPGTNYPNLKTFERAQGRVPVLEPGASHQSTMEISVHATSAEVESIIAEVERLQAAVSRNVHIRPLSGISPA